MFSNVMIVAVGQTLSAWIHVAASQDPGGSFRIRCCFGI